MHDAVQVQHLYLWHHNKQMWLLMGRMQPIWLIFLSRKCQYINLSDLPARMLRLFFSNSTPASRAQRVTWGCCSYFLLAKLSSTLGLRHQVVVDAKTSQVRATSRGLSGRRNKSQVERDPKNVSVRAAIKKGSSQARVYCKHIWGSRLQ